MSDIPEHGHVSPQSGIFDADELLKILGDNRSAIDDLSRKYRQLLEEQRIQIQQVLRDSNWTEAANLTHQLKSSSRVVGAFMLADCCENIEKSAKTETGVVAEELIDDFDKLSVLVLAAIDEYLQTPIV